MVFFLVAYNPFLSVHDKVAVQTREMMSQFEEYLGLRQDLMNLRVETS